MSEPQERDVEIGLVDPPPNPSRETIDPERIGTLADDIAVNGLLQKPGIRGPMPDGRYELMFGHRRLLAVASLGWKLLPAKVYPPTTDPDVLRISENFNREELTPIEEARECQGLINRYGNLSTVARLVRKSPSWVSARLDLLGLPADIQAAVNDRTISIAVGQLLGEIDHDNTRREFLKEAVRVGAKAQTAAVWIQHYKADRDRIITNQMTVDNFVAERESWVIKVPCAFCGEEQAYTDTITLRVDRECAAAVMELIQREATAAAQQEPHHR